MSCYEPPKEGTPEYDTLVESLNDSSEKNVEISASEFRRLKQFDGADDHPEHRCERCSGRNISCWYADNDEWNKVVGDEFGIICPNCFNELSALKGVQPTAWRISREGDDPLVDKLRARILELSDIINNFPK